MAAEPGSSGATAAGQADAKQSAAGLDGAAPDQTDFANYFCTYAFLYHQVALGAPA